MRNKTPPLKRSSRVIFFFQNIIKYPSIFLLQDCCSIVIHLSSHLRDGSARLALIGADALLVPICSVSTPLLYCVKSFIVLTFSLISATAATCALTQRALVNFLSVWLLMIKTSSSLLEMPARLSVIRPFEVSTNCSGDSLFSAAGCCYCADADCWYCWAVADATADLLAAGCWLLAAGCWLLSAAATVIFFISLIGDCVGDDLWACMDVLVDGADYWPLAAAAPWRGHTAP